MSPAYLIELGRQTLFAPRKAAAHLLDLKLPQRWLWMALFLMTVLNAIAYSVSLMLSPPPEGVEALPMVPPAFQSPLLFTVFLGAGLAITVIALSRMGQLMGGKARMVDILVLITWLQVLRLAVQVALLVLMLVLPGLAGIVVIAASLWGMVVLVAFLNEAHQFESIVKTVVMLMLTIFAMVLGLSLILGVIGVAIVGGASNV